MKKPTFKMDRPAKRFVQNANFKLRTLPVKHFLGLAGDNPEKYSEVINSILNPKDISLCDIDPTRINHYTKLGDVAEIFCSNPYKYDFIDLDFCAGPKGSKKPFQRIVNCIKRLHLNVDLSFTMSVRTNYSEVKSYKFFCNELLGLEYYGYVLLDSPQFSKEFSPKSYYNTLLLITSKGLIKTLRYHDTNVMFSGYFKFEDGVLTL